MAFDSRAVREAAQLILNDVAADHRYGHTSHLQVRVAGETIVDEHLRGPVINNVFSITKSVLASALGVMAEADLLPPLDSPVADVLPALRETPARAHTWRHLLTMTRGAQVDGPWEIDAVVRPAERTRRPHRQRPAAPPARDEVRVRQRRSTPGLRRRDGDPGRAGVGVRGPAAVRRDRGRAASTGRPIRRATRPARTGFGRAPMRSALWGSCGSITGGCPAGRCSIRSSSRR